MAPVALSLPSRNTVSACAAGAAAANTSATPTENTPARIDLFMTAPFHADRFFNWLPRNLRLNGGADNAVSALIVIILTGGAAGNNRA
jgi:hypothetical protein